MEPHISSFVDASEGLDGRQLRKAIVSAGATSIETAQDLNKLEAQHIFMTLKIVMNAKAAEEDR